MILEPGWIKLEDAIKIISHDGLMQGCDAGRIAMKVFYATVPEHVGEGMEAEVRIKRVRDDFEFCELFYWRADVEKFAKEYTERERGEGSTSE